MKPAADDIQANEFLQLKRELVLQTLRAEIYGVPRLHPHSTADPELCRFAITVDTSTLLVAVVAVPDTHTSPHIATVEDTDKTNPNAEEGQSSTNTIIRAPRTIMASTREGDYVNIKYIFIQIYSASPFSSHKCSTKSSRSFKCMCLACKFLLLLIRSATCTRLGTVEGR